MREFRPGSGLARSCIPAITSSNGFFPKKQRLSLAPLFGARALLIIIGAHSTWTSRRSIQLVLEATDDSRIIVGFDRLNLSATSNDHKIALDRLAKIVDGYLRSSTVCLHLIRACIGSLEDVAIGAIGLRSGEISLPVRNQPSDCRKG
jgi:hypothetical protein